MMDAKKNKLMQLITPMKEAGQTLPSGVESMVNPPPAEFEAMTPQERMLAMARGDTLPDATETEPLSELDKKKQKLMFDTMKGKRPKPAGSITPYAIQTPVSRGKQVG